MTGCTYKCFTDTVHDTTKLHDFFFAEALDKLKNGGIMAFVTSAGTLDKRDESTRQMLADKADFIGAIRLPGGKNGAFKDNAGTEVTKQRKITSVTMLTRITMSLFLTIPVTVCVRSLKMLLQM